MSDRRDFLEDLVFRSLGRERFNQRSPILPDVWLAYGLKPGKPQDLLLTPHVESSPKVLAKVLRERLRKEKQLWGYAERKRWWPEEPEVAYNQTSVAARLYFHEAGTTRSAFC